MLAYTLQADNHTMLDALKHRTVIIGNSGSGKSTLATRIAEYAKCAVVDLDMIHWDGDGFGKKRDEGLAKQMTASISVEPHLVIEGIYGWLADVATPRATALIWLNLPWNECKAGLERRGPRRVASDVEFAQLMLWAERYWIRQTPSSFVGHSKIFDQFTGKKIALDHRPAVSEFLKLLPNQL